MYAIIARSCVFIRRLLSSLRVFLNIVLFYRLKRTRLEMRIARAQTLTFEYLLFRKTSIVLVKRLSRAI